MPIIAIYGIIAAVIFGLGGWAGHTITANSYKADMLDAERSATAAYQDQAIKLNEVSAALEKEKNAQQIVYRNIEKKIPQIVDRPVYRDECLDDDGLRIINEALTGKESDTGKPAESVPAVNAHIG